MENETEAAGPRYLAMAREGRPGVWRVLLAIAVFIALYFAVVIALFTGLEEIMRAGRWPWALSPELPVALLSIAAWPLLLAIVLRLFHRRALRSVFGLERRLKLDAFLIGGATSVGVGALSLAIGWSLGMVELTAIERPEGWWIFILAFALLIPFQAGGEELVFRGYLAQELGARWSHWIAWGFIPTLLFTAGHYVGPERGVWEALAQLFAFGAIAGAVVYKLGGLSTVIGFHTANNWVALLLFEPDLGIDGIGYIGIHIPDESLAPSAVLGVAGLALAYLILARWARPEQAPAPRPESPLAGAA